VQPQRTNHWHDRKRSDTLGVPKVVFIRLILRERGAGEEGGIERMSVKYAVLGLLVQRRGYGYDLVQRFGEQVGPAWQLNAGAIYVALDKLEQEGLVRPLSSDDDAAPPQRRRTVRGAPRVIYEVTDRGVERFDDWMSAQSTMAPLREELHLKLALSRPRNLPRLIELTYEQEQSCMERLEQYTGRRTADDLLASSEPWSGVASAMLREAEIAHLQATVEWLRRIRAAMKWVRDQPGAAEPVRG
jgi:DNA-binding PadR family transcriptional regulator